MYEGGCGIDNDIIIKIIGDINKKLDEIGEFRTLKLLERVITLSQRKRFDFVKLSFNFVV